MTEMDKILNGYLRMLDPSEKKAFLGLAAELAGDFLGGEAFGIDDAVDYYFRLNFDKGWKLIQEFVSYAFAYGSIEFCKLIEDWVKDSAPWLSSWIEKIRKTAAFVAGVTDGEDIRYDSVAQTTAGVQPLSSGMGGNGKLLIMDTDVLRSLSAQAASLSTALSGCAGKVENCADLCDEYEISVRISVSAHLKSVSGQSASSCAVPAEVLRRLKKSIIALQNLSDRLSNNMMDAANRFDDTEDKIAASVPSNIGTAAKF